MKTEHEIKMKALADKTNLTLEDGVRIYAAKNRNAFRFYSLNNGKKSNLNDFRFNVQDFKIGTEYEIDCPIHWTKEDIYNLVNYLKKRRVEHRINNDKK